MKIDASLEFKIYKYTFYLAIIPIITALVSFNYPSVLAMLVGLIISFLLFRLKKIQISQALDMGNKANRFIRNRYFINYLIYFAFLYVAYKNPNLDFLGAIIGLLLLRYTIIFMAIIDIVKEKWQNKIKELEERGNLDESRT